MKQGEIYKINCKAGAISYDIGIFINKIDSTEWMMFLVDGDLKSYSRWSYAFTPLSDLYANW
tara:strand:+ start:1285 stop:1470 length:186 start_codon:yes stop_codon:yes gene_type:complete